ncbi:MAG: nucleotidyl transferase AbiEii/AbiGii toxin family protein [Pseudomonadota bacterium]
MAKFLGVNGDTKKARLAQTVQEAILLPDVPAPTLRAYPKATVVAEKLDAVTVLGMTNARMKDFFDLALLLRDDTLDDAELQQAVEATFARRQTAMPSTLPIGLSDAVADDTTKQTQWRAFLNKNKLDPMDLREVIGAIPARATQFGFPRP